MTDFLLELRSEEIPARMQAKARADLEKLFVAQLADAGLKAESIAVYSTPRRLALIARGLPQATEPVSEEAKGPPEGAPDQAVDGFCRKQGVSRDQLEVRDVKGRPTYFAVINRSGRATSEVLGEAIPAIIRAFPWPKSQRWGEASISTESLRWVRPLSGIIALFGGELVDCEIDGIKAGRETMGHRFVGNAPLESITIDGVDDYAQKLREAYVIVDHDERQDIIREGAAKAASDAGLELIEDEGLVIENAGLTEWPVPLLGRFDESFLDVPPEVIQLTARVNQKYFVVNDAKGNLTNAFVCTANLDASDGGKAIVAGNEKVLAARLADAKFFWELDQKTPLAQHAEKLKNIVFHEKLGTVADKVERVAKLARWLCQEGIIEPVTPAKAGVSGGSAHTPEMPASAGMTKEELANLAEQAAKLCKADLVTEMVGEFPDLQGLMGGYYAEKEGLPVEVSDAIRDHYKPVGQGDEVPTAPVTVAVSLADKLDNLMGFYAIGAMPTGSKDPFALRRATIATISLILASGLRSDLSYILKNAFAIFATTPRQDTRDAEEAGIGKSQFHPYLAEQFEVDGFLAKDGLEKGQDAVRFRLFSFDDEKWDKHNIVFASDDAELGQAYPEFAVWEGELSSYSNSGPQLLDFFADRLKVQQKEAGVRHDLIDAVFALGGEDDLVRLLARVKALQSFMDSDDGANLLAGYKRAANILKQSSVPAQAGTQGDGAQDNPGLLPSQEHMQAEEVALLSALDAAEPKATAAIEAEQFEDAMAALASLRAPIDAFFDNVMVNDEDAAKRNFRLGLLTRFTSAVHAVADFSKIEG